ncbi:hypothetical protein EB155_01795, partial [archaeon]|nr:hypothetical protein [archaeon]
YFYSPGEIIKGKFDKKTELYEPIESNLESVNYDTDLDYNYRNSTRNFIVEAFSDTSVSPSVPRYRIDGIKSNDNIELYKGMTYTFTQYLDGNEGYPLAFSDEPNGAGNDLNTSGYVTYYLDSEEVTRTTYEDHFNTPSLWNRGLIAEVKIKVPFDIEKIYFYSTSNVSIGNAIPINLKEGWRGHLHWDRMNTSLNFKGEYDYYKSYHYNDVVSYEGETYRALGPNHKNPPINKAAQRTKSERMTGAGVVGRVDEIVRNHGFKWEPLLTSKSGNDQIMTWTAGKGPLGWKYKHHSSSDNTAYRNIKFIDRNGTVWTFSNGTEGSGGQSSPISYGVELCFNFSDERKSYSRGYRKGYQTKQRKDRKFVLDDNLNPKCIQIESYWSGSIYLFDNGSVYANGRSDNGQLGWGKADNDDRSYPVKIDALNDHFIVKIAITQANEDSVQSMAALSDDGRVFTWGYNGYGQAGQGHTNTYGLPTQIPQEYFGHKKVIDIGAYGATEGGFFVRTEDDHVYGWGRNNAGLHGVGDTGDNYRPVKMQGWDPVANGGIACWQMAGYGGNATFMLLDGNGFLWHCGYNGYGQAGDGTTSNHYTLTKSTLSPNGNFVDFWLCHWNSYITTFMRHTDGKTYASGASRTYYLAGTNVTGDVTSGPQLVDKVVNLDDVRVHGTYSDVGMAIWLQDDGKLLTKGYDTYNNIPNPHAGSNWSGEDGTQKPHIAYVPAGDRINYIQISGGYQGTSYRGLQATAITENGQIGMTGMSWIWADGSGFGHSWGYHTGTSGYELNGGLMHPLAHGR